MQSLNDDDQCKKCHVPYENELLEHRAASFKLSCQKCHFQKFRCYCPAQNCGAKTETVNANEFVDGYRIKCASGSCHNVFQVIKCPHPSCGKFSFFNNGNYAMGELINCKSCKIPFQQLTCPHCYESNYWRGDVDNFYAAGNITECYSCKMKFQHLNCPHCKFYKYFPDCNYTSGVKQNCNNCHRDFQHALCVSCFNPNYYPQCNFRYGTPQTCSNTQCKNGFELVICPDCGKENLWKGSHHQQNQLLREYNCWNCHSKFSHQLCSQCHESVYLNQPDAFSNGINSFKCPSCRTQLSNIYKCQTCKKVWTNSSSCKQCPPPRPSNNILPSGLFGGQNNNHQNQAPSLHSLFGGQNNNNQNQAPPPSSLFGGGDGVRQQISANTNTSSMNSLPSWLYTPPPSNNNNPLLNLGRNQNNNMTGSFISGFFSSKSSQSNSKDPEILNQISSKNQEKIPSTENSQDLKTCVVCMDNPAEIAFIPCGHKKTCQKCSEAIMKTSKKQCPVCRKGIQNAMKIFD